ncbi:hypothetical protein KIN20_004557 [Parelaphostrongylus tenuis]|uniref:Uncharacterized protein n=1 Tax=Parelaphostrongylus tenuis TaxID=148309 RepID=A0AAD5QEJ0_PARTN|nr:hypothetical protein KIN20_004557 [Parelaphostrongylus tenuis]
MTTKLTIMKTTMISLPTTRQLPRVSQPHNLCYRHVSSGGDDDDDHDSYGGDLSFEHHSLTTNDCNISVKL